MKYFYLFIFFLSLCPKVGAQQKFSRSYTVKEGLPSNTIYTALVDSKGYMWFGTDAGVSVFDGTTFTNFSIKDGLADNDVLGMFEDNEGRIWFYCYNQQPCFYYKGKFFNAGNFEELRKIEEYNWQIALVSHDEVWFTGKEKNIYRFRKNKITEYNIPATADVTLITDLGGTICFLKDSLFYSLNKVTDKFELYPGVKVANWKINKIVDLGSGRYLFIKTDIKNTLFNCYAIDLAKKKIQDITSWSYNKRAVKFIIDKKSNVFRTTFADNTVVEKETQTDSLKTIAEYKFNSVVSGIAADDHGNKWFAMLHQGVELFPVTQAYAMGLSPGIKDSCTYYSVVAANNRVIVGNDNNSLSFIGNGRLLKDQVRLAFPGNNRTLDMKLDKHGTLWIATDNGVCIYDVAKKVLLDANVRYNIKDLKYDERNDNMLIATSMGAFVFSCKNRALLVTLKDDRSTCIAGSSSDTCWVETLNGLYLYDGKKTVAETLFSPAFQSRITCMETDKKKRLWLGTASNGVFVVQSNKVIYRFTKEKGMTSDICKNIFIDEHNEAWICTNQGISHISEHSDSFNITRYNDKNCLVDNNVNDVLVVHDTVYAVSSSGIAFFNKHDVADNYSFPVYVNKVKVANGQIPAEDSIISLGSSQNTITISFSGLSYLSNGDITYRYWIKELNDTPIATKNNAVTYSRLAPGTYNFYVSAADIFGNKSIRPAHVQFTIVPEWYQLVWLRWLAAIGLVAIAILITLRYSRRIEERKRLRLELDQTISRLELEAIHSQINPHFVFNCLNAIQNAIYNKNAESASYFINRFAKLMRKALMLSKESFISIDEEYDFINNYLEVEQLRNNHSFDYAIDIDPALSKSIPCVPAFVLQPFIENAISHGIKYMKNEMGMIRLSFVKTDKFEIRVDDNGIGMTASKKINQNRTGHKSKGIELMMARIASLNKIYMKNIDINITDKEEQNNGKHGTTVVISLDL